MKYSESEDRLLAGMLLVISDCVDRTPAHSRWLCEPSVSGGWLAGWLAGWLGGWVAGWLAGWLGGWLAGWLGGYGWVAGCLGGWLAALAGWLAALAGWLDWPGGGMMGGGMAAAAAAAAAAAVMLAARGDAGARRPICCAGTAHGRRFAELRLQPPLLDALKEQQLTSDRGAGRGHPAVLSAEMCSWPRKRVPVKPAYLLPIVHALKREEARLASATSGPGLGAGARLGRPRCLVLVPSREVGRQVLRQVKALSHFAKLASASLCDRPTRSQRTAAVSKRPIDVLVSTPGRLLELLELPTTAQPTPTRRGYQATRGKPARRSKKGCDPLLHLTDLRFVVFDEGMHPPPVAWPSCGAWARRRASSQPKCHYCAADVLLDDEFGPTLLPILHGSTCAPQSC